MDKEYTREELDAMIVDLQKKRAVITKSSYDTRPVREKIAYDFQALKLLTFAGKFILISLIIGAIIFVIGLWKGKQTKPVMVDMKDFQAQVTCKYTGEKHDLAVRNYRMYFDDKAITEGDIPKLKPFGIELHPKLFAGLGSKGMGIGAGFEFAHFYKLNADVFLMSDKAAYIGISYDLKMDNTKSAMNWFENSAVGIALGKGMDNPEDTRIMVYWTMRF